jgi:hypothetical protein
MMEPMMVHINHKQRDAQTVNRFTRQMSRMDSWLELSFAAVCVRSLNTCIVIIVVGVVLVAGAIDGINNLNIAFDRVMSAL